MKFSSWLMNMTAGSGYKVPPFITHIPIIKNVFTLKIKLLTLL